MTQYRVVSHEIGPTDDGAYITKWIVERKRGWGGWKALEGVSRYGGGYLSTSYYDTVEQAQARVKRERERGSC
jgi:hypothetical protein